MNLFKKLSLIFVGLFIGCTQPESKQTAKNKPVTFAGYLNSLDNIPLPFTNSCSGPGFPRLSSHFDSTGFEKFKDPNSARPLGILFNDKANVVTVDISLADYCLAPILVSFNKEGKKIDALSLYGNSFQDTASSSMPYFKIESNKRILVIDTIEHWKRDTSNEIIPGSKSVLIDSTTYFISKNGKFVKQIQNSH